MKGFLLKAVLLLQLALATCQQIQPREDNHVVRVKVEEVVPRHLCRRALRNLEVRGNFIQQSAIVEFFSCQKG